MSNVLSPNMSGHRLGQLLTESRMQCGGNLEALARNSALTVGELADLEAGHRLVDDDVVAEVSVAFEKLACGLVVPKRDDLTIDLSNGVIQAAGHAMQLESLDTQAVLDDYLALVYQMRDRLPGTEIPLRDQDVELLASSLNEPEELIFEQLSEAMRRDRLNGTRLGAWIRRHVLSTVGGVAGFLSTGAVALLGADDTGASMMDAQEAEPLDDTATTTEGGLIVPATVLEVAADNADEVVADQITEAAAVSMNPLTRMAISVTNVVEQEIPEVLEETAANIAPELLEIAQAEQEAAAAAVPSAGEQRACLLYTSPSPRD